MSGTRATVAPERFVAIKSPTLALGGGRSSKDHTLCYLSSCVVGTCAEETARKETGLGGVLPEHVVDADDALRLRVSAVVDDGALRLHPHEAAALRQHAVLTAHYLAFAAHWTKHRTANA